MKRSIILVLALALVSGIFALAEDTLTYGDFTYVLTEAGTAQITGYTGASGDVEIPSEVNGAAVTSIGSGAFIFHEGIKHVTVPEGVTEFGAVTFMLCRDMVRVELPDSLCFMLTNPFAYCDSLMKVDLSSKHEFFELKDGALYSKPDSRLMYCPAYKSEFAVAEGTHEIGDMAFAGCLDLEKVTIPDSVNMLCYRAFENCVSLKEIVLPGSVVSIDMEAFIQCESLKSVTLPDGISYIDADAFKDCPADLTATVVKGSYAEKYCLDNGIAVAYAE